MCKRVVPLAMALAVVYCASITLGNQTSSGSPGSIEKYDEAVNYDSKPSVEWESMGDGETTVDEIDLIRIRQVNALIYALQDSAPSHIPVSAYIHPDSIKKDSSIGDSNTHAGSGRNYLEDEENAADESLF